MALALVLFFLAINVGLADKTYTVVADESASSCPGDMTNCSLMYYATHSDQYFRENNTTFFFLSGHHQLVNSTAVVMENVWNLTLYGSSVREVSVVCDGEDSGGFLFYNITNLTIRDISIISCSIQSPFMAMVAAAVSIDTSYNVIMITINILNTTGQGLLVHNLHGINTFNSISVQYSNCSPNTSGINFAYYCSGLQYETEVINDVIITNSSFTHGNNDRCNNSATSGGISIEVSYTACGSIVFENSLISGNHGRSGGNVWINLQRWSSVTPAPFISFTCCSIGNGTGNIGGGISVVMSGENGLRNQSYPTSVSPLLTFKNILFEGNRADYGGGAVYINLYPSKESGVGLISFSGCAFASNNVVTGGAAVHVETNNKYIQQSTLSYELKFNNCTFTANSVLNMYGIGGTFYTENTKSINMSYCIFNRNLCSGIVSINSIIFLNGQNEISNNRAFIGGGMYFSSGSIIHLSNGTHLIMSRNQANSTGGGIHIDSGLATGIEPCFFQVDNVTADKATLGLTQVELLHNRASYGTALYGGKIDACNLYDDINEQYDPQYASKVFNLTFNIQHNAYDLSVISSEPEAVRFCQINSTTTALSPANCSLNTTLVTTPGKIFRVSIVIVGQRYGYSGGFVVAKCISDGCQVLGRYTRQSLEALNKSTEYSLISNEHMNATMKLDPENYSSKLQSTYINICIESCPLGFTFFERNCTCTLANICDPNKQEILRKSPEWVGYYSDGIVLDSGSIIVSPFCPLGYCINEDVYISSTAEYFYQDVQCADHRTGLLCGECKENYSLGFGSSRCLAGCNTRHQSLGYLRVIGLTAVCGVAGILLVVLLTLLNLTVTEGTLNGLIFYANIVHVNTHIFFPSESHTVAWTTLIAWLNLDFGVSVCFYDGMDAYVKTWLQFLFPLYLLLLSGGIIYCSRISLILTRFTGKNAVKVLATLILLLFGKLIRTVLTVMFWTKILSYDGKIDISVWLLDGNVFYFQGKHSVLMVVAGFVGVVAILYTLTLTFIQCLRRSPNNRVFGWVHRLKPLLDAYTGPYKDRYHFWTGFLFVVRIGLFTAFALNITGNPTFNLTVIIIVSSLLVLGVQSGIYRNSMIGLLESSLYINLILFSFIEISPFKVIKKAAFGDVLMIWVLLTLFAIICYHTYKQCVRNCAFAQKIIAELNKQDDERDLAPLLIEESHND